MIGPTRAFDEVNDFLAGGTSPRDLVAFRPSEESRQRVAELIDREKTAGFAVDVSSELDHWLELEHLMRLVKARAQRHLRGE